MDNYSLVYIDYCYQQESCGAIPDPCQFYLSLESLNVMFYQLNYKLKSKLYVINTNKDYIKI